MYSVLQITILFADDNTSSLVPARCKDSYVTKLEKILILMPEDVVIAVKSYKVRITYFQIS